MDVRTDAENTPWYLQCISHRLANATLQVEKYLIDCIYMILEDLSGLRKGCEKAARYKKTCSHMALL